MDFSRFIVLLGFGIANLVVVLFQNSPVAAQFLQNMRLPKFGEFKCPEPGLFPVKSDCRNYYRCLFTGMNPFSVLSCKHWERFDPVDRICGKAELVDCQKCAKDGIQTDVRSAENFIKCTNGYGTRMRCQPAGKKFDPVKMACEEGAGTPEARDEGPAGNKAKTGSHAMALAVVRGGTQTAAGSRSENGQTVHALSEGTKSSQAMAHYDKENSRAEAKGDQGAQSSSNTNSSLVLARSGSDGTPGSKATASASSNGTQVQSVSDQHGSGMSDGVEVKKGQSTGNGTGASRGEIEGLHSGATRDPSTLVDKGQFAGSVISSSIRGSNSTSQTGSDSESSNSQNQPKNSESTSAPNLSLKDCSSGISKDSGNLLPNKSVTAAPANSTTLEGSSSATSNESVSGLPNNSATVAPANPTVAETPKSETSKNSNCSGLNITEPGSKANLTASQDDTTINAKDNSTSCNGTVSTSKEAKNVLKRSIRSAPVSENSVPNSSTASNSSDAFFNGSGQASNSSDMVSRSSDQTSSNSNIASNINQISKISSTQNHRPETAFKGDSTRFRSMPGESPSKQITDRQSTSALSRTKKNSATIFTSMQITEEVNGTKQTSKVESDSASSALTSQNEQVDSNTKTEVVKKSDELVNMKIVHEEMTANETTLENQQAIVETQSQTEESKAGKKVVESKTSMAGADSESHLERSESKINTTNSTLDEHLAELKNNSGPIDDMNSTDALAGTRTATAEDTTDSSGMVVGKEAQESTMVQSQVSQGAKATAQQSSKGEGTHQVNRQDTKAVAQLEAKVWSKKETRPDGENSTISNVNSTGS